ncbi:MAG: hypothetical protein O2960_25090 [Verrucomicrobia bacterium]|nr:hypothetical protein [Verrucomicrobiota bacterium]
MNTKELFKSMWERSTIRRFLVWISSWRILRPFLFGIAALVTLVFLFYAIENWRGKRAWEQYRKEAEARGEVLDWQAYVPPPVPGSENFAMTPFLAPLFDFVPDPKPGENLWRDTNGFARVQAFAKDLPYMRQTGYWHQGDRTDLASWLKAFDETKRKPIADRNSSDASAPLNDPGDIAAAISKVLSDCEPVIDELRAASQRPMSRFPVRYDQSNPAGILLPHLALVKRVCQVLKIRALSEMVSGDTEAAFRDLLLMFFLIDAHREEPFLISQLVRLADFQLASQVLWEGLADHRFTEPQLAEIQSRLSKLNFLEDMDHSLRSERAFGIKIIDWIRQSPDWVRTLDTLGSPDVAEGISAAAFWAGFLPRGWLHFEKVNYARLFEEFLLSGDRNGFRMIDPSRAERNDGELNRILGKTGNGITHHMILAKMLLPALSKVQVKAAFYQSAANEAETACALERYRIATSAYPERLEDLVPRFLETLPLDVVTGKPLIYRRVDGDRFVLYSIGWNEKDDGGLFESERTGDSGSEPAPSESRKKSSRQKGLNLEEGDWVWKYPKR